MSQEATREYLANARPRYQRANRQEKGRILTEFCLISGYNRKHAIRLMNLRVELRTKRSGPVVKYGPDLVPHLKFLWLKMGQPCSKRLKKALPVWLPYYRKRVPELRDSQVQLLREISPTSIDRLLKLVRVQHGLSATRVPTGTWYKNVIPIQTHDWNITQPGHLQGDTVAHCGNTVKGTYVNTLTLTDVHTSWTENRATWGKGSAGIIEALKDVEQSLPFSIHSIKFDSGSEFMNYGVISHLRADGPGIRSKKIEVLRSRPYRKNDNCYVEEKNLTHVRQLIGYDRLEDPAETEILNRIYREYWNPLQNFFLPAMKLIRKERVGSRIKKQYDSPQTPYQRLLEAHEKRPSENPRTDENKMVELRNRFESLDPLTLQEGLERELKALFQSIQTRRHLLKFIA